MFMLRLSHVAVSAIVVTSSLCQTAYGINTAVTPVGTDQADPQTSSTAAQRSSNLGTSAGAIVTPTTNEGENARNLGDYVRAEKYFAATVRNSSDDVGQEISLRTGYGESLLWQDKISEAAAQFKRAKSLTNGRNARATTQQLVRLSDDYSWLAQAQNKADLSIQYAQESVQEAKADQKIPALMLISGLTHLAYLQDLNDQLEKAAATYRAALAVDSSVNQQKTLLRADIMEELGGVLRRSGHIQEANQQFKEGLQIKLQSNAPLTQYEPHAYWNDVIYRFQLGAPNCLRKLNNGADVQIVTANGVTVAATMSSDATDLVKSGRVDLSIKNEAR
jgi:hypothetical protein